MVEERKSPDEPARVARWISIFLHPLILFPGTFAAVALAALDWQEALPLIMVVSLIVIVPLGFFMVRQARSGKWGNVDASRPEERPALFRVALPLSAAVAVALYLLRPEDNSHRGALAVFAMLALAFVLVRWVKLSLHVASAAFCAVVLTEHFWPVGVTSALLVLALGWSRLAMRRHTVLEVVVGALAGLLAGLVAVY